MSLDDLFLRNSVIYSRLQLSVWESLGERPKVEVIICTLDMVVIPITSCVAMCGISKDIFISPVPQVDLVFCCFFINVPFSVPRPVFLPVYQLLTVDLCICWRCHTVSVCGWMWQLTVEVGGAPLRPNGRCDQACFSASPLAPIGVTMLHLACESSREGGGWKSQPWRWLLLWVWVKGGSDKLHLLLLL